MNTMTFALKAMAVTTLTLAAGCASPENGQPFFPDDRPRPSRAMADSQAARGAADDAMLYARHFDGADLSDLGKDKLYRIAEARTTSAAAVPVYLNLPETAATTERKDAVVAYLRAAGLADERIALRVGPNPDSSRMATLTAGKLFELRPDGIYTKQLGGQADGRGGGSSGGDNRGGNAQ